jgi:hypothetical protein
MVIHLENYNNLKPTKPCEKCKKECIVENENNDVELKARIFKQNGDLYLFNDQYLCFGCFLKAKVRG